MISSNSENNRRDSLVAWIHAACNWSGAQHVLAASLVGGVLAFAPGLMAQSVQLRSAPLRVTVADAATGANMLTNYVAISGTPASAVNLNLLGLPGQASASFGINSGTASFGTLLTVNYANVPEGVYPLDLNASGGAADDLYLTLQSGRMWTGSTNVTTAWSNPASWVGGTVPGAADDVLFTSLGGQTNAYVGGNYFTNSVVDQNFTISSLRFSQTNGTTVHSIYINPGVTLAITGSKGLSLLQDYTGTGSGMTVNFSGTNGTLEVSNETANVTMLEDDSTTHTLDMSRLGTFVADVSRVAPGDYTLYPYWTNINAQGFSSSTEPFIYPNKFYPKMNLAATNYIKAVYVDPYGYSNVLARSYAVELVNNPISASSSSATPSLLLGITNVIDADGVCISGFGGTTAAVNFNPALEVVTNIVPNVSTNYFTNSMYAVFRNSDGVSRMSTFCVGDLASAQTNSQGNTKGNVNFAEYNGHVDMLVDRFYMSRDRTNDFNSSGDDAQTTFAIGAGTVNANTVIIGDQENGDQPYQNFVYGTMAVSNTAVLQVNNSLQLGYETADANDTSLPGVSYGVLNIGPGGTVMVNSVGVGGITKNSGKVGNMGASSGSAQLNTISLTNGATLVVSNTIADATAVNNPTVTTGVFPGMLGAFNIHNSELVLNVNGTNTGAYVYTSALNYAGSVSNYLVIASINNLSVPATGSTNIPLIWIQGASPNAGSYAAAFSKVIVPSGYQGALILDATNSQIIDLSLSLHVPRNLEWKGYVSGDWDTTTQNWLDLNTGLQTNYDNGDFTTFDDSSTVTNINITSSVTLIPNNITVTNSSDYYTFAGSGTLNGGATITKSGTGVLEIDAQMTLGVQVNQGYVVGSGLTGGMTVASGAGLDYSGTINGSLYCAGLGLNYGTINGPVSVQPGGVFTNFSTIDAVFMTSSNSLLYNAGAINYSIGNTATIATNSTMINAGNINGDVISDSGIFEDLGVGNITLTSLSIAPGGQFIPGGSGIGTTTINSDGSGNFPGAVLLTQGSTTVFNVDVTATQPNTIVNCDYLSYGGSATAQTQNGGTLELNNVGTTPFAAGQSFQLFKNIYGQPVPFNTGTSTNTYPVISPATPGPGLTWNLKNLWVDGSIGIVAANSGPALTNSFFGDGTGTNIVGQFSWDSSYQGYRLETLVVPLSVGLTPSTNYTWTGVAGSQTNTSELLTNAINPTNCVFYRLAFP